jgi:signal peptidase I
MESATIKPRRAWLAVLLCWCGGPVGQIYCGRLRRSIALWGLSVGMLAAVLAIGISWPLERWLYVVLIAIPLTFQVFIMVDAFVIARRTRNAPLKPYQRWWFYLLAIFAFWVGNQAAGLSARRFVAEAFVVPTRGMAPTIRPGDRILVDKLWRHPKRLRRGDLVVFRSEGPGSPLYVMRLVGLPGDEIEIRDEQLRIDGQPWSDEHAVFDPDLPNEPILAHFGPLRIPDDSFFALGDNRRMSRDSRILGPIPLTDLHGIARLIYWARPRRFPDPWDTTYYESGPLDWDRMGTWLGSGQTGQF